MEKSNLPKHIRGIAVKHAGEIASKRVTPSKVAEKMGAKLCKILPKKMKEKGLTVRLEEVFREGPFVVLQLQVQHVDLVTMEKVRNEEISRSSEEDEEAASNNFAGTLIDWSLKLIGTTNQKKLEESFLPAKVQAKLETSLTTMMGEKFKEKQIQADIKIVKEKRQARYFYEQLREVRLAMEQVKRTNPFKQFRKKLSYGKETQDDDSADDEIEGF